MVAKLKVDGNGGETDCEIIDVIILRKERVREAEWGQWTSKTQSSANSGLVCKVLWEENLRVKVVEESWQFLKEMILKVQQQTVSNK